MTIDFKKHYLNYGDIRDAFVSEFIFFKSDGYFSDFTVQEDLSSLGMGYRIFILTEDMIVSLSISKLERCSEFKICKKDSKISPDWSVLRSEFNAEEFFNTNHKELSSDFDDVKRYLNEQATKLSLMLKEEGVEKVISKLD
jgi:hypothetical protein